MVDNPTQDEKREVLQNVTLFSHQQNALDDAGGRFSKINPTTLTGTTPQYPKIPSGPWSGADPVPPEEPLGFDVNALDPIGTPAEVQASLNRVPEEK